MKRERYTGTALAVGLVCGQAMQEPTASAQQQSERKGEYFPNTEELAPDEMRVIALGTGMPNATKAQKASAWLKD